MIINVRIGQSAGSRKTVQVDSSSKIKEVLDNNGVGYSSATINLDGQPLSAADLNSTFDSFNVTTSCNLTAIVKTNNA